MHTKSTDVHRKNEKRGGVVPRRQGGPGKLKVSYKKGTSRGGKPSKGATKKPWEVIKGTKNRKDVIPTLEKEALLKRKRKF